MNLSDIQRIAEQEVDFQRGFTHRINVCCSSGCVPLGAFNVLKAFQDAVKELGVERECKVAKTGCFGTCSAGPAVIIDTAERSRPALYESVTPEKAQKIVQEHIVSGSPVKEMLYKSPGSFKKQKRLVLKNAGWIDPTRIQDYIALGGYSAIVKALATMTPQGVIYEVSASRLRGRDSARITSVSDNACATCFASSGSAGPSMINSFRFS